MDTAAIMRLYELKQLYRLFQVYVSGEGAFSGDAFKVRWRVWCHNPVDVNVVSGTLEEAVRIFADNLRAATEQPQESRILLQLEDARAD